ncbi:helix-turn-helix transcriptional regulator [Rhizobium oryzicola]|uniref:Helix-turn-helix transcriptional regulator n=1 Tax=Rhizobium oryzicola TaxID=1232668 RepID=A0ABT8T3X8_9HYPH|nr:helix-turn-helix transcriptional regulator [Rhizobium oryzicola]MDO1585301.1 helix-turn-helix transcriptional regulator [Rhizobium oryzicola]
MPMSEREFEEVSGMIGLVYETVLDQNMWPTVLELICQHLNVKASRIYWRDASNGQAQTVHSWGIENNFIRDHKERYVTLNPLYPISVFVKPGQIFSSGDIIPNDEFRKSRFFTEWVEPQGFFDAAIFNIQRYQATAAAFTVITGRDYGLVDERLRSKLRMLAPHLQRAALIRSELDATAQHAQSLEAALEQVEAGVFILDSAGHPLWANRTASNILTQGSLLRAGAGGLSLISAKADRILREGLISASDRPEYILQHRPAMIRMTDAEGVEWVACLMQLGQESQTQAAFERVGKSARAALFIRKAEAVPISGIEAAARFYSLTAGEIRVLHVAMDMDTVAEMAETLGISPNTVKKHLSSLFGKMNVSRRAGLIKAVLAAGP